MSFEEKTTPGQDISWQVVKLEEGGGGVISIGFDAEARTVIHSLFAWIENGQQAGGWCIRLGEGEEDLLVGALKGLYEMHGWEWPR